MDREKRANIAAGIWLVTTIYFVSAILSGSIQGNIWESGNSVNQALYVINGISLVYCFYYFLVFVVFKKIKELTKGILGT